jgi:hypothetical protein
MGNLLFPTKVRIEKLDVQQEMDDDFRSPRWTRQELLDRGVVPVVRTINAQVTFASELVDAPVFTGDNEETGVQLVILAADQRRYDFRVDDFVVGIMDKRLGIWRSYELRIHEVRPIAQKSDGFQFYRILASKEAKA